MPKKEVFLAKEDIEYIAKVSEGKYSEWIRKAVQAMIKKEKGKQYENNK